MQHTARSTTRLDWLDSVLLLYCYFFLEFIKINNSIYSTSVNSPWVGALTCKCVPHRSVLITEIWPNCLQPMAMQLLHFSVKFSMLWIENIGIYVIHVIHNWMLEDKKHFSIINTLCTQNRLHGWIFLNTILVLSMFFYFIPKKSIYLFNLNKKDHYRYGILNKNKIK